MSSSNEGTPLLHHQQHLPDIPENKSYQEYFDDDDDLNRLLSRTSNFINENNNRSGMIDEAPPERTSSNEHTRRRTLSASFDIVLEDAAELFQSVTDIVTETVGEVKEELAEIFQEQVLPVKPREEGDHSQKLSTLALAVLVFYKVSGGPFGCEPAVRAAGPFYALLGFIIFPLVWCLQEALITAELGSAYPEPSGAIAWIEEAFGPRAGLLCGYFHWVAGATDNAIYPCLFLQYLIAYLAPAGIGGAAILTQPLFRFFLSMAISTVLSGINFTGLEIVGNLSMIVCVISMSPFVLLCILGIPKVDISRWFTLPDVDNLSSTMDKTDSFWPPITFAGVLWRPFINNLFWNLNSFDVGASFAGEVQNPERVFPKAMFLSVVLVCSCYLLPLLVAIGTSDAPASAWNAGYLTTVAGDVIGPWLAAWMVLAAAISNIALYEAEMSGDAYQLMGMAHRGLVPKIFGRRSRFGTPTYGIITGTLFIFALGFADFDSLVEMLNFAYSVSLLMEFAAFIQLRITDDDVPRPYRIPFNTVGCVLFLIPSCMICMFVMFTASKTTYLYFAILTVFGILFHFFQKTAKHYHWWEYEVAPLSKKKQRQAEAAANAASKPVQLTVTETKTTTVITNQASIDNNGINNLIGKQ